MQKKRLPISCPSCHQVLRVRRLECMGCNTAVEGTFDLPLLAQLDPEDQTLILNLVKSSGSLKDLARLYGVSYPTVRNRLDALIEAIGSLEKNETRPGGNAQ